MRRKITQDLKEFDMKFLLLKCRHIISRRTSVMGQEDVLDLCEQVRIAGFLVLVTSQQAASICTFHFWLAGILTWSTLLDLSGLHTF